MARTVLVVDDDPAIQEVMGIVLQNEGYAVELEAGSRIDQVVEEVRPDLMLLDVWLNGVDGREVAKRLKSQAQTRQIPIILMSAHSSAARAVAETGAEDFLEKPFDLDELVRMVKMYAGR